MTPFLVAVLIVCLVVAIFDWKIGQIPNWVVLPALFLSSVVHAVNALVHGLGSEDAGWEVGIFIAGAIITGLVPMILYCQNAIGGGDLKLLAAIGVICQPSLGLEIELYGFLAALVIVPVKLAYDGKLFKMFCNTFCIAVNVVFLKEKC